MVNEMLVAAIGEAFGDIPVYQGQAVPVERPAFYLGEIKVSQEKGLSNRYYRRHMMAVHYFPAEKDSSSLGDIADKLYAALEYLGYDGWRGRGIEMYHRIEDNVLQFFLTVQLALKRPENNPKMENIMTDTTLRSD